MNIDSIVKKFEAVFDSKEDVRREIIKKGVFVSLDEPFSNYGKRVSEIRTDTKTFPVDWIIARQKGLIGPGPIDINVKSWWDEINIEDGEYYWDWPKIIFNPGKDDNKFWLTKNKGDLPIDNYDNIISVLRFIRGKLETTPISEELYPKHSSHLNFSVLTKKIEEIIRLNNVVDIKVEKITYPNTDRYYNWAWYTDSFNTGQDDGKFWLTRQYLGFRINKIPDIIKKLELLTNEKTLNSEYGKRITINNIIQQLNILNKKETINIYPKTFFNPDFFNKQINTFDFLFNDILFNIEVDDNSIKSLKPVYSFDYRNFDNLLMKFEEVLLLKPTQLQHNKIFNPELIIKKINKIINEQENNITIIEGLNPNFIDSYNNNFNFLYDNLYFNPGKDNDNLIKLNSTYKFDKQLYNDIINKFEELLISKSTEFIHNKEFNLEEIEKTLITILNTSGKKDINPEFYNNLIYENLTKNYFDFWYKD